MRRSHLDLQNPLHPEFVGFLLPLGKKLLLEGRVRRVPIGQDAELETVRAGSAHESPVHLRPSLGTLR